MDELVEEGDVHPVVVGGAAGSRLLLFTGTESLRRWRRSARFLSAPGHDLLALAQRLGVSEVTVDPAGPREVRVPVEGARPSEPGASDRWTVRAMTGPLDAAALFRIRRRLERHVPVSELYLFEVTVDGSDVLVAGFDVQGVSEEAATAVVREGARSIAPLLPVDLYAGVQFALLSDEELAPRARAVDAPVYVRAPAG